jgi:hypothetical protein
VKDQISLTDPYFVACAATFVVLLATDLFLVKKFRYTLLIACGYGSAAGIYFLHLSREPFDIGNIGETILAGSALGIVCALRVPFNAGLGRRKLEW